MFYGFIEKTPYASATYPHCARWATCVYNTRKAPLLYKQCEQVDEEDGHFSEHDSAADKVFQYVSTFSIAVSFEQLSKQA